MTAISPMPFLWPSLLQRPICRQLCNRTLNSFNSTPTLRHSSTAFANYKGKQVFKGKSTPVSRASRNRPQKPPRVHLPACKFPSNPPPTPDPAQIEKLPYYIHRTASQQLPVYKLAKRGGNLRQTRLRKIEGDLARLRSDLQDALSLESEHIKINQLTKHIIIKVCQGSLEHATSQMLISRSGLETIRCCKIPDRSTVLRYCM